MVAMCWQLTWPEASGSIMRLEDDVLPRPEEHRHQGQLADPGLHQEEQPRVHQWQDRKFLDEDSLGLLVEANSSVLIGGPTGTFDELLVFRVPPLRVHLSQRHPEKIIRIGDIGIPTPIKRQMRSIREPPLSGVKPVRLDPLDLEAQFVSPLFL